MNFLGVARITGTHSNSWLEIPFVMTIMQCYATNVCYQTYLTIYLKVNATHDT